MKILKRTLIYDKENRTPLKCNSIEDNILMHEKDDELNTVHLCVSPLYVVAFAG